MSGGASKAPVTYAGPHDATLTYLPLRIVTHAGGTYLSVATNSGVTPDPSADTPWLPLGGGAVALAFSCGYDTFTLASTTGPHSLSAIPKANSWFTVNLFHTGIGRPLLEGTDFTVSSSNVVTLLTAAAAAVGDVLEVRYIQEAAITRTDYPTAVLVDSPAGYWRLGEASGTSAADSSGNGRNGTYNNLTLGEVGLLPGDPDTCVKWPFLVAGERVEWADAAWMESTSITVEAIVSSSATAIRSIFDRDDGTERVFQFRRDGSGHLEFIIINGGAASVAGSIDIADGNPHHVAATYDGATIKLYVDGVPDGSLSTSIGLPTTTAARMFLGVNNSSSWSQGWQGWIDEAAFYTTALTAGQIAAHFAASGL